MLAACSDQDRHASKDTKTVFICTGGSALRYHLDKSCPGLNKCKHTIITTTLLTAQKRGRSMCGWEINDGIASDSVYNGN